RALDVVAVALLVAMQTGDVAGDQLALGVVPGPGADAIARVQTRRGATLFLAEIRMPCVIEVGPASGGRGVLANLVGAGDAAEIAGARRAGGNEEAHRRGRRLLRLRQQCGAAQKRDGDGGKNGRSVHCGASLVTAAMSSSTRPSPATRAGKPGRPI